MFRADFDTEIEEPVFRQSEIKNAFQQKASYLVFMQGKTQSK